MSDGHTRRDAMWVDNHIRDNAFQCEWQVFLAKCHSTCPFLSVPTGEFVANLWNTDWSNAYLGKFVTSRILWHDDQIDYSFLSSSRTERSIFELSPDLHSHTITIVRRHQHLTNKDLLVLNGLPRRNNTIIIQLIHCLLKYLHFFRIRLAYFGLRSVGCRNILLCFITSIKHTTEHTSLNGRLVDNNTILLIVTCETSHCYNWIATNGHLHHWDILGRFGGH